MEHTIMPSNRLEDSPELGCFQDPQRNDYSYASSLRPAQPGRDISKDQSALAFDHNSKLPIFQLPDELFLQICGYLEGDAARRIAGRQEEDNSIGRYAHTRAVEEFRQKARTLRHLALTSRLIRDVAQSCLFHAPVLSDLDIETASRVGRLSWLLGVNTVLPWTESYFRFVRTLLDRPDLARNVKMLRLRVVPGGDLSRLSAAERQPPTLAGVVERARLIIRANAVISDSSVPEWMKEGWALRLRQMGSDALAGVILHLVKNLQRLAISVPSVHRGSPITQLFGKASYCKQEWNDEYERDSTLAGLAQVPGLSNLEYLCINGRAPFEVLGLCHLPKITELEVSLLGSQEDVLARSQVTARQFQHISFLRVDCRMWEMNYNIQNWQNHLTALVPCFTNVRHIELYAEEHVVRQPVYQEQVFLSRAARMKEYSQLVRMIEPIAKSLETLVLPGGFWGFDERYRIPGIDWTKFEKLQVVTVPIESAQFVTSIPDNCFLRITKGTVERLPTLKTHQVDRDRMEVVLIRGQKKEQAAWMLKHVGISDLKLSWAT